MKRYGNIFEKIVTIENIKLAHEKAKRDKSFYNEVKMVDENPDYYFNQIQDMLINRTYTVTSKDYTMFKKVDKGKEREIFKLDYFPHRVIQHALMNHTQNIFLKTFIDNSFSSVPERGIHLALKRLDNDIKNNSREDLKYCLKIDVKKFYPNIDQEIAKEQLRWKFKDKDVLWLFDTIIDSMENGIAIGSLVSQWIGNFYMTKFDHWIKELKGIKFFYRYCDDIVILHHDKNFLHQLKNEIEDYISINLKLKLKENWQVFPTFTRGIDFVGYRHFGDYILLRKSTAKKLKTTMRKLLKRCLKGIEMTYGEWCSINSYKGWLIWCDGHNLTEKYIKPLIPFAEEYYKKHVKNNRSDLDLKKFSDFASEEDFSFTGDKLKIEEIVGKEVIVKGCKIGKSKYSKNGDDKVLTLYYEISDVDHVTFTGSSVLIDQSEKYKDEMPFTTKIEKVNKFYTFT